MERIRRQQRDSAVMVVMVVAGKEALAKSGCILDGGERGSLRAECPLAQMLWPLDPRISRF
jgi:hypothetical protein